MTGSCPQNDQRSTERHQLADQHQVNSIIAAAICDCSKDNPEAAIEPEKAKQMAKCIIEALRDAGLEIRVYKKP
jgi:hypothetical protein